MGSSVETFFTPFKARTILQPWRWVCDVSIRPTLFAIIPEDLYSHKDTAKHISTKFGTDGRLFFFLLFLFLESTLKPECWLGGRTKMADDHCSWLKMKDSFSINHNPRVWQNQLLKCIHDTFFAPSFLAGHIPRPCPSNLLCAPWARTKMVEVYLLYFLLLLCGARCAGNVSRFCHWKHWRVCKCIVSLKSLCLVILLST